MNTRPDADADANLNTKPVSKEGQFANGPLRGSEHLCRNDSAGESDRRYITALRPLVRYVDARQAVIEVQISTGRMPVFNCVSGGDDEGRRLPEVRAAQADPGRVELLMQIAGSDGFIDESRTLLALHRGEGVARFEVVEPQRWWPAGMGDQPLYEMTLSLMRGEELMDSRRITLGLTSVRRDPNEPDGPEPRLLVNGQICSVRSVLPSDHVDENQLLPATGDSLLLVRDHYGPDVLYQAADRAGILMVQCVPIHPEARPEIDVARQVDRLAAHPSLAGWFVGHLGRLSDQMADRLGALDPTRAVFRDFSLPVEPAA